jgi:histidine ammonia-lyase
MTVTLSSRGDITLEAFRLVAWGGERIRIAPAALERVDAARSAFLRLAARPDVTVYGVTSAYGDRAGVRLEGAERAQQALHAATVAGGFGEPLPERVARGIVLARLANLIDGHAAVSGRLVSAVAALLDQGQLPPVPARGHGESGEILALARLFGPLVSGIDPGPKEGLALINGSPCAAALVADAALAARARLALAYEAFALSVEAFKAPLEAYDEALETLWDDEHDALALQRLRGLLGGAGSERRGHQAAVSFRILPRVLGQAERAVTAAERAAAGSLRAVTDNPVYLPPSPDHPDGRSFSTGGYHNAMAPAALHGLAVCWADLCQLAERHAEKLLFAAASTGAVPSAVEDLIGHLLMAAAGIGEEARAAAAPVILPRSGPGQNDVTAPALLAWPRERTAADCLEAALAVLIAAASQALMGARIPPALEALVTGAREDFPPLTQPRPFGSDFEALIARVHTRVLELARDEPHRTTGRN